MKKFKTLLNAIFISIFLVLSLLPFVLIFISCFNTSVDIKKGDIFSNFSLSNFGDNFIQLFSDDRFLISLANSLIVSIITVVCGIIISSLAGYAYIVYKSKKSEKLFNLTFFAILIPSTVLIVPLFILVSKAQLLDSLFVCAIASMNLPFYIYLFRQNTKLFPIQLIQMARIDGLSELKIFFKIWH